MFDIFFFFKNSFSHDCRVGNDEFFFFFSRTLNQNFCVNKSMAIYFFFQRSSLRAISDPMGRDRRCQSSSVDVYRSIATLKITPTAFSVLFFLVIKYARCIVFFFLAFFFSIHSYVRTRFRTYNE